MRDHNIPVPEVLYEAQEAKRVLIVDDEPGILENVVAMLEHLGTPLDTRTESDGIAACIAMGAFRPHLLILDLKMPRMDGYEVCRKVRSDPSTRNTRILVATGYGSPQNVQRALDAGADDFITKPFRMETLHSKVADLLGVDVLSER